MSDTIDIMIDLETLGTAPGSVILSIGAVCSDAAVTSFEAEIDLRDALYHGLTISKDTLAWWRRQERDAWLASTGGKQLLAPAFHGLAAWISNVRKGPEGTLTGRHIRVWGDGASFDPVLLEAAYEAVHVACPWTYTEVHCYRTVRSLLNSKKPASRGQHQALADAQAQLVHLLDMLKTLRDKGIAVP
jgi:hypothetical protein